MIRLLGNIAFMCSRPLGSTLLAEDVKKNYCKNSCTIMYKLRPLAIRAKNGKNGPFKAIVRFSSTLKKESEVKPVYTKLSDENDPERNLFFKYTWGTWLKNDKAEKEKRFTSFSIEGLNKVIQDMVSVKPSSALPKPQKNSDNTVTFTENVSELLGTSEEKIYVKTMASIHEGKHNRLYKIDLSNGKTLALRVPYKLLTEYATSRQIQSEVATMDFARHKLGLRVPKVLSYGMHSLNPVRNAYTLMEYIPGTLLMRQWNPAVESTDENHRAELNKVIEPLADFQSKLLEVEFNQFGSLYFHDDVSPQLQLKGEPYEGETDDRLKNRWRIGLSTDRNLWRGKSHLKPEQFNPFLQPISKDTPEKIIENAAYMEVESLRTRLGLSDADASSEIVDAPFLKHLISVLEATALISKKLFNRHSGAIPHADKLFAPRLYHPDIDPMNTIVCEDGSLAFLDFENTTIKPFIYTTLPNFVNYAGFKIYDLKDIPEFEKLSEQEKYEFTLMMKRTRNQHLWEWALSQRNKELIASVSPYIKELKSPYTNLLLARNDKDFLFIEESLLKIKHNWEPYVDSKIVDSESTKYPLSWSEDDLKYFETQFTSYQKELMTTPFATTQGWVPQDTFEQLLGTGQLEKVGEDYVFKN